MRPERFHVRLLPREREILAYISRYAGDISSSEIVRQAVDLLDQLHTHAEGDKRIFYDHPELEERYGIVLAGGTNGLPDLDSDPKAATMSGISLLQIRLSRVDRSRLERLADHFGFNSKAAVVREALGLYQEALKRCWRGWRLVVQSPGGTETLTILDESRLPSPCAEPASSRRGRRRHRATVPEAGPLQPMLEGTQRIDPSPSQASTATKSDGPVADASSPALSEELRHVAPAASYVARMIKAQDQYEARVRAIAMIGAREHFWSEEVAERIWRSAVPESIRIFVFEEFEHFQSYYESLLPHAGAYNVYAILAKNVPAHLRSAVEDFALIDANGDKILATYEGHGDDARISFCRAPELYARFERQFRSLLEISARVTRDHRGTTLVEQPAHTEIPAGLEHLLVGGKA